MSCFNMTLGDSIAECCQIGPCFIRLRDGVVLFEGLRQFSCPMALEAGTGSDNDRWRDGEFACGPSRSVNLWSGSCSDSVIGMYFE